MFPCTEHDDKDENNKDSEAQHDDKDENNKDSEAQQGRHV